ncbi:unnamed protein product [Discosporangium mesarthrocarpum]
MQKGKDESVNSFLAEWFDPLPQLTKQQYLLKYFPGTNEAEMVELKSRRLFLKRSPCPDHLSSRDFHVGAKVILYGRDLFIVSYGDKATEAALAPQTSKAFFLVGPEACSAMGNILDELLSSTGGMLAKIKMFRLNPREASAAATLLGSDGPGAQGDSTDLSGGATVAGVLQGADLGKALERILGTGDMRRRSVWVVGEADRVSQLVEHFWSDNKRDGLRSTATFDSCTCCVIKPHAVKEGHTGKIIDHILTQVRPGHGAFFLGPALLTPEKRKGYEISALELFHLNRTEVAEFLDVYQGVIPEFSDAVDEMTTGPCLAMEIRAQDPVTTFRQTAGPWDVDMAKELRPKSIRASFGVSNIRSGVHCTDLPEDGEPECRYFFELMQP